MWGTFDLAERAEPDKSSIRSSRRCALEGATMAPVIERRLLSVKTAAAYLDRTEKAIRHLYERGTLTPIRIDGRVYIDPQEIERLIRHAREQVY